MTAGEQQPFLEYKKELLDLIDVTSSLNMLQDVHHIYYIETSDKAAEISED